MTQSSASVGARSVRIALAAVGGFALVLASMIWMVVVQMTDFTQYDAVAVGNLERWIVLLVCGGLVAVAAATLLWWRGRRDR